ncbi:hypothetical protein P170DRAFT_437414 [Aspergillus steynii IBT 23096]|uniref:N-acetyltransferase domain-containing protein n=1 Tax=Aspergillus steynii IBT 23096 TaxID=1392250 RepID=A0A2I2G3Z7_9EURO|nr:uncharacterized protein P170DRAFT_437414 [Aspergillus steynii IBT 23096]PLB47602.1 hypothetical protein P170DRAFT_437414 [Aspergillus steynii IBT 23096]
MISPSPSLASQCRLDPINLTDPDQFHELHRQRLLCGWDHSPSTLEQWSLKQSEGLKNFFWITIPSPNPNQNPTTSIIRAGHISLDAYSDPPDPELSREDKSILAVQTFFVLPEYQSLRLGSRAMDLIEEIAASEPKCRVIALTALSKRYMYEEGLQGRGLWERIGMEMPRGSIQEWYEKRGYVGWKEEERYEESLKDGGTVWLWEVFMRKVLR